MRTDWDKDPGCASIVNGVWMNKPDTHLSINFDGGSALGGGVALVNTFVEKTSSSRNDQRRTNSNETRSWMTHAPIWYRPEHGTDPPPTRLVLFITPQDRRALQLLASERGSGEIAEHLGMSTSEVDSYLSVLFAKIGAASQSEAVAIAARRALLVADLE